MRKFILLYLTAFVVSNLLVKNYGAPGLLISSFLLIPLDFVCRCIFHETWEKSRLFLRLFLLTIVSGVITFVINHSAFNIALASVCGFSAAQLTAGFFYQSNKEKNWFYKVNISDLIAICTDSIVFQYVAFSTIDPLVTGGQILIKFLGGLFWYFILFKIFKIQLRLWKKKNNS